MQNPFQMESFIEYTEEGKWPLETIALRPSNLGIFKDDLTIAISSALPEISRRWIKKLDQGPPQEMNQAIQSRYRAFLIAQVAAASLWVEVNKNKEPIN